MSSIFIRFQKELEIEERAALIKASWENPVPPFEEQFAHKEEGISINAIDVRPALQKSAAPVVFVPGWSENKQVLEKCIRGLFNANRRVLSLTYAPASENVSPTSEPLSIHEQYALELLTMLDEKGIEQADIVAHSSGAISAIELASTHPDRVRNIVLLNPGGLMGETTGNKFLRRVVRHLMQSGLHLLTNPQIRKEVMRGGNVAVKYLVTQPVTAVKEAQAISTTEIHDILSALHEGHGIAVIAGEDDRLFPAKELRGIIPNPEPVTIVNDQLVKDERIIQYPSSPNKPIELDAVLSFPGIHNELFFRPNIFMQGVDRLLFALERKRSIRQAFMDKSKHIVQPQSTEATVQPIKSNLG